MTPEPFHSTPPIMGSRSRPVIRVPSSPFEPEPSVHIRPLTLSRPRSLVKLDIVCREQTRLPIVFSHPPILVREFLFALSHSSSHKGRETHYICNFGTVWKA